MTTTTTTTNISARTRWMMLAAIAAVPAGGLTGLPHAAAQYQQEQRGDALDSNRRVGDDYRNDTGRSYRIDNRIRAVDRPTGNQIVTGNVTGNRQFRGDPGYRSEREFRGGTASDASDSFIRSSSGISGASRRVTNYNVGVPFYPAGATVDPPPGFTQQNLAGGGYVPTTALDNRIDRGAITPRGGSMIMSGPIEPVGSLSEETQPSIITASPLLGVQQMPYSAQPGLYGQPMIGQRPGILDESTIERMRNELRTGTSAESGTGNFPAAAPTSGSEAGGSPEISFDSQGRPIQRGIGTPIDANGADAQQQQGGAISAQPLGSNTVGSGNITGQSTRQRLLPTPGEQTPAYAELRRRLQEIAGDKTMTDEQAHRAARRAHQQAEAAQKEAKGAQPTTPAPGGKTPTAPDGTAPDAKKPGQPQDENAAPQSDAERLGLTDFSKRNDELLKGGDVKADQQAAAQQPAGPRAGLTPAPSQAQPVTPAAPGGARSAPVKVDSLAKGVPGKGLADLLTSAETLMKEGRFSSALEKYDGAEQVAPNNPLIKLGRANAELGASYFARADQHLREAFAADEALLMGQYNLRAFFGEDRLKVIANDLKDIAHKEQDQVRPVFLLAYVAYNSENERLAAGYLDLADKRSGGKDPLIGKLRKYWTLPAAGEEGAPVEGGESPDRSSQTK